MKLLLKGKNIVLRGLEPEDLSFLYDCENNTEIWNVSNTISPFSKYVLKQYIENSHHDIYINKQLRLIISLISNPDKPIGAIDLFDFDPYHLRAGVGILIHEEEDRKKGYAKEALAILIRYCFIHLKLNQLYCNITNDNLNSIKLFKQAGFEQCGEKKKWLNSYDGWKNELMFQLINHN